MRTRLASYTRTWYPIIGNSHYELILELQLCTLYEYIMNLHDNCTVVTSQLSILQPVYLLLTMTIIIVTHCDHVLYEGAPLLRPIRPRTCRHVLLTADSTHEFVSNNSKVSAFSPVLAERVLDQPVRPPILLAVADNEHHVIVYTFAPINVDDPDL